MKDPVEIDTDRYYREKELAERAQKEQVERILKNPHELRLALEECMSDELAKELMRLIAKNDRPYYVIAICALRVITQVEEVVIKYAKENPE